MSIDELVAAAQAGDHSKLEELWDKISGLVKWKASRTMTALKLLNDVCRVEFDDLYQSGYFAMLSALETYKPENGSFPSWLMYYLQTAFAETAGYRTKQGRIENGSISLDEPLLCDEEDNKSKSLIDTMPDSTAEAAMNSIEEIEYQKQLRGALESALAGLPENQRKVIKLRYFQNQALAEAGKCMGVTAERVRYIEKKGLDALRKPKTAAHLIPFLEFDYYLGTGLGAFINSGMSIQEKYVIIEEQKKKHKEQRERAELEKQYAEILQQIKDKRSAHAHISCE